MANEPSNAEEAEQILARLKELVGEETAAAIDDLIDARVAASIDYLAQKMNAATTTARKEPI